MTTHALSRAFIIQDMKRGKVRKNKVDEIGIFIYCLGLTEEDEHFPQLFDPSSNP